MVPPLFPLRTRLFSLVMALMVRPPGTLPPDTVIPTLSPAVLETRRSGALAIERPDRMVPPRVATAPRLLPEALTSPPRTKVPPAKLTLGPKPPVLLKTSPPTVCVFPARSRMAPPLSVTVAALAI